MVLSALVTAAAIWALFVVGGRVFSGAVLQSGGRIRLRDAWRASGQEAVKLAASRGCRAVPGLLKPPPPS